MTPPFTSPTRSVFTNVAGLVMHSVVMGKDKGEDAPVFVLVPGLGLSGRYMMPTAKLLAAVGTVWIPDLPGCGKSERPRRVADICELADALMEWMETRGIRTPVLIGNSLGAQVIVDLAARHPERLDLAVLVAPTIDPEAPQVSTQLLRLLADGLHEPFALYWIALKDYLRAGFGRVLQILRHALADPVERKLSLLRCPVLIIRGALDPIVPQRWVEWAVRLIPKSRLVVIPGAAHAVNFNSPDELVLEVIKFMENVRCSPGAVKSN